MNNLRRESAQTLPIVIFMFVILCGFAGFAIDVGYGLLQKRKLQAAVDLGLISGARELPSAAQASNEARSYVNANFRADQPLDITTSTSCMNPGCARHDRLTLRASTQTPTFFLKLFGVNRWTVGAQGAACGPCDASPERFDVVVVLDRSGSMSERDMSDAKQGIKELVTFFDPSDDRLGLVVLEPADTHAPRFGVGAAPPCESDPNPPGFASSSYLPNAYMSYGGGSGAFMDGTPGNHDTWLVVPLANGTNFKRANGTINTSSQFISVLNCIQRGGSTPIGPAIEAARNELVTNGRNDALKVIVYFGDGGASATPLRRECRTRPNARDAWSAWRLCNSTDTSGTASNRQWRITGNKSWYDWTPGNRDRPCQDAIDQSRIAANNDIDVYTIGYGVVSSNWCRPGLSNSPLEQPAIREIDTIRRMASDPDKFYEQSGRGDIGAIFQEIGRDITAGGTRLVD